MLLPICCFGVIGSSQIAADWNGVLVTGRDGPMVRQIQNPQSEELKSLPEVADKLLASKKSEWTTLDQWIADTVGLTKACKAKSFAFKKTSKESQEDKNPVMRALYVCGPSDGKTMIFMSGVQKKFTLYLLNPDGKLQRARLRKTDERGQDWTIDPVPNSQAKSNLAKEVPVFLDWVNEHKEDLRRAGFFP